MKDPKDYIHLYLKAPCTVSSRIPDVEDGFYILGADLIHLAMMDHITVTLQLRPFSDMTEEEKQEEYKIGLDPGIEEQFRWLLSKGFDLFGLIEAGLAIDKTKLP